MAGMSDSDAKPAGPRCLSRAIGCPSAAEWDLLNHAQALNAALCAIRLTVLAEARGGTVDAALILRALDQPYRFPLPGDTEALAAYRKVYEDGNRTILHLAECGRCDPVGYDRDLCQGYFAAVRADADEAQADRVRGAAT
jgi:hypothetical protein